MDSNSKGTKMDLSHLLNAYSDADENTLKYVSSLVRNIEPNIFTDEPSLHNQQY